jgi:cytochrome c553
MKTSMTAVGIFALFAGLQGAIAEEAVDESKGAELFNFHGCVNCHGADGKSPVSKMVPELAGKPAGELYSKATKILSGDAETDEARLMHAAFYSPSSCDAPPTDAQIKSITSWLAEQ